jgi:SPP1 family predicted phage head-tail adaptor
MTAISYAMNRRITIEQKVVTQDVDYGTEVVTWAAITNGSRIAANWQDELPSRSESVKNGIRIASQQARVRIRHRTDITSAMRVTLHGTTDRTYQIIGGPAEVNGRRQVEMMVELYSSQGGWL